MNLLRKLKTIRNRPPYPDAPFIEDRHGIRYWITWNEIDNLHISSQKGYIGRINLDFDFRDDDSVVIADIITFQSFRRQRNLRGRGLGKAMLEEALRYAQEKGAKVIWGWTSPDEYTTHDYLAEWYSRQGFDVFEEDGHYIVRKFLTL